MSRILVISTNPRRGGNSDLLCDQVLKGAIDAGNDALKLNINLTYKKLFHAYTKFLTYPIFFVIMIS